MVRPVKKKQISNLPELIKDTAWEQIAEFGAPALSLRAIAREIKITAPAIYNYFPRRDDLVTSLIVDAYNSLADSHHAPEEATLPAATRAIVPLMTAIQAIFDAGRLRIERLAPATPRLKSMLKACLESTGCVHTEVLYLALVIWSRVHGLVMLEITNQFPAALDDPAQVFQREMANILNQYL